MEDRPRTLGIAGGNLVSVLWLVGPFSVITAYPLQEVQEGSTRPILQLLPRDVDAFNLTLSGLEARKRKRNLAGISGEQHNHMTCAHKRPQFYPEPDRIKDTDVDVDVANLFSHHTPQVPTGTPTG